MADSEKYFTKAVDGQLSVATVSQSGEIIPEESRPGDVYTTALVNTDNGPQLCVKTIEQTGTLISDPSEIYATALVQTSAGKELCVKTYSTGGGGGGGGSKKYGVGIDSYLGSVDENGVMETVSDLPLELVFTGVKTINSQRSIFVPSGRQTVGNVTSPIQFVKSASFPDLEEIQGDGLRSVFESTGLESVSFPKLKYIGPKPNSAVSENAYALGYTFLGNSLKTVTFPELLEIKSGVSYVFNGCFEKNAELTSVSFPKLKVISGGVGNAFGTNSPFPQITTTEMPALEEINTTYSFNFYSRSKIQTVNFPSLKKLSNYGFGSYSASTSAFYYCKSLTTATFPVLEDLTGSSQAFKYAFASCTSLISVSFGGLKSTSFGSKTGIFNKMLDGVTGCTVHFPSNLQSVIGSWSDVTDGFGGTNTTVLFDLPATE